MDWARPAYIKTALFTSSNLSYGMQYPLLNNRKRVALTDMTGYRKLKHVIKTRIKTKTGLI